jgi:hypothetical protein
MPENVTAHLDTLMSVLFLITLLLYIIPAAMGPTWRGRAQLTGRAAIMTLVIGLVVALVASARWFMR